MVVDAITLYVQNFFIQFNSLSQVISENSPLVLLAINVSVKKGYVSIFESIDKSNCNCQFSLQSACLFVIEQKVPILINQNFI